MCPKWEGYDRHCQTALFRHRRLIWVYRYRKNFFISGRAGGSWKCQPVLERIWARRETA